MTTSEQQYDLVVVGAGIVGLAHALDAHQRGARVAVVERDEFAVGASVQNFGHVCTTAQSGQALRYAIAARDIWLTVAEKAGFEARECGTVVLARSDDEAAVLAEFADQRGTDQVRLLGSSERDALPVDTTALVAAAHLRLDLRVDPRIAVPSIARWLQSEGVAFLWHTSVGSVEADAGGATVRTSRGDLTAAAAVVSVGHDVDRLFPAVAEDAGVERCRLQMLEVEPPRDARIDPALLSGSSILRYPGLASMPSAERVRGRFEADHPDLVAVAMNLMLTQRPDGTVVLGDTHHYGTTHTPFDDESHAELVLREGARLLGAPLRVRRRWRGVYASAPDLEFLVSAPSPPVRVVSVTSGIGMTTALGLAPSVLTDLL